MEFRPFIDFVNFVGWGFDPLWDPSTLNKFDPCWVCPRCGMGLDPSWGPSTLWTYLNFFFFFYLVGSVHVVDYGLDPPWGPSTLWTFKFSTIVGSVHVVDWGLDH